MRCTVAQRKLEGLLGGTLDARTGARLEEHLRGCPGCAEGLRQARQVWSALGEDETPAPGADFTRRLWAAIDAGERARPKRLTARYAPALALVGATACAVVLGVVAGREMTRAPMAALQATAAEWPVAALDRVPAGSLGGTYEDLLTGGGSR